MVSDLYLVAHKVRGEAAFDVAEQMECPLCHGGAIVRGICNYTDGTYTETACVECDGAKYWWIIPTSGHRAYPYWHIIMNDLMVGDTIDGYGGLGSVVPEMPPAWPDHYKCGPSPKLDIKSLFKATQPSKPHIARRL